VDVLPLSQSTITQHLKELKQIGIIKGEVEGPKVNYCIDENVWEEAKDIFINMFSKFIHQYVLQVCSQERLLLIFFRHT